ncbi:hypothetical protein ABMA58_07990, partial [Oceanospirillum sp. HFRX-1_2]
LCKPCDTHLMPEHLQLDYFDTEISELPRQTYTVKPCAKAMHSMSYVKQITIKRINLYRQTLYPINLTTCLINLPPSAKSPEKLASLQL